MSLETQEEVQKLFVYCANNGLLYWKSLTKHEPIGTLDYHGYLKFSYKNKEYYVHRIIWIWCFDYSPKNIYHLNRKNNDNRLDNLSCTKCLDLNIDLNQNDVKYLFNYNKDTGELTRRFSYGKYKIGDMVGRKDGSGYLRVTINNRDYGVSRIIWLWWYGVNPSDLIDHLDGHRDNNRIENLRESTYRQNSQNMEIHRLGKLVGSSYDKSRNRWISYISFNKTVIRLGQFKTAEEANVVYIRACKLIDEGLVSDKSDLKLKLKESINA
jgi:hypothetical protein